MYGTAACGKGSKEENNPFGAAGAETFAQSGGL